MALLIRPATAADLPPTIEMLAGAGLPIADIGAQHLALAAENNNKVHGIIGLEAFGDTALLRSLVVADDVRGGGTGAALVTALERNCRANGVKELWLLTIDADRFFAKLGYVVRSRTDAPAVIQETKEFSVLCPHDAVLMSKEI